MNNDFSRDPITYSAIIKRTAAASKFRHPDYKPCEGAEWNPDAEHWVIDLHTIDELLNLFEVDEQIILTFADEGLFDFEIEIDQLREPNNGN